MNLRKRIAILVSAALVIGMSGITASAQTVTNTTAGTGKNAIFSDISGHWAKDTIEEAVQLNIVGGYPDGTFLPDNLIKREEFYTLVGNILTQKPDIAYTKISFTDVDPIEWYVATVKTAVAGGMTNGYPDGTFGIGRMMTRQEAAQVASTVLSSTDAGTQSGVDTVKDKALIDKWAYDAVDLMFKKGYMKGDSEGNFRPTNAITRAEAVQLLLQIKKKETVIVGKGQSGEDNTETTQPVTVIGGCMKYHLPQTVNGVDTSQEALDHLPEGVFKQGNGTESSPYEITTQEQLNHIREHNQAGIYFKLTQNIEISSDFAANAPPIGEIAADWRSGNWQPIGTNEKPFLGNFDGNHFTISGLKIDSNSENDGRAEKIKSDAAGLFGWTAASSRIQNVRVSDSEIKNKGGLHTGAIAGHAAGTISNCSAESSTYVEEGKNLGGIAGYSTGNLISCTSYAKVESTDTYTGGIVGFYHAGVQTISKCEHRGKVSGSQNVGGIAGCVDGENLAVVNYALQDSVNYGTVEGQKGNIGGICGSIDGSNASITLHNCTNKGTVKGSSLSGGIAGYVKGNQCTIDACLNEGEVEGGNTGGIVGANEGTVQLCKNEGTVDGDNLIGGIIGFQQQEKSKVTKCFNTGTIGKNSEAGNTGGIAGESSTLLSNSYNEGKIYSNGAAGGIIGKNIGRVLNVYNSGDISEDGECGSIVGRNLGSLTSCFWLEDTATKDVGINQNTSGLEDVYMVTEEQLSGEVTFRTVNGYELVLDMMNTYSGSGGKVIWEKGRSQYPQLAEMQD